MKTQPIKRAVCYALLIACLGAVAMLLFFPLATIVGEGQFYVFSILDIGIYDPAIFIFVLFILALVVCFLLLRGIFHVLLALDREDTMPQSTRTGLAPARACSLA